MSKSEATKIVKKFAELLRKNRIAFEQIYLFGSYATGTAKKNSDIDIAVIKKKRSKNPLKDEMTLWKLAPKIDSRIEPILLDRQDLKKDETSIMGNEILKHGILVATA